MSHLYYANKEIQFLFESNDLSEIDYLLKNGLDINSSDIFNHNALFTADFEKTQFLVNKGINIFQKSYYDRTAVMSSHRKTQNIKKVKYLINKGLTPNKAHPYLLHFNSIEVLEFFIKKYNFNVTDINKYGYNTLFFTNRESAEFMISKGVDPFYKDPKYDLTTLFSNELETLELLISKGVDPFYINKGNENQLYGVKNLSCLKYLLNFGLDPYHKADSYENLLFSGLNYESLNFLVNNYNYDINEVGSDGKNLLFTVENIESMDYLIKKGLDPFVLFDDKTLIEYMPIECIPYLLNMGVHKAQNHKLCFSNEIDSKVKHLIINKNIEDNNINILNKENGNNLLFENIDNIELSCKLINSDINLYYINDRMADSSKSHFLSCVNNYTVYNTAKNKGLFNNEYYNLFLKDKSIKIENKNILHDLLKSNRINIEDILFSEYPTYQTKYLVNYVNINKIKDGYTALLKSDNLKKTISLIKYGADVNYISEKNFELQDNDMFFIMNEDNDDNIFQHLCTLYKNNKKYDIFSILIFLKKHGLSLKKMFFNSKQNWNIYSAAFFELVILSNKIEECISLFYDEIEYIDYSQIYNYDPTLILIIINHHNFFQNLNNSNIFSLYNMALHLYYKKKNKQELLTEFITKTHSYIIENKTLFLKQIKRDFFYFQNNSEKYYIQPDLFITEIVKDIQFILFQNDPDILYSAPYLNTLIIDDFFLDSGFDIHSIYSNNENILFKLSNLNSIQKCIEKGIDYQHINYEGCNFISKRIFDKLFKYKTTYINTILKLIEFNPNFTRVNYYGENCIELLKQENLEYYNYVNNLLTSIELQKTFDNNNKNNDKKSRRL